MLRRFAPFAVSLCVLAFGSPAQAQTSDRFDQQSAEEALEQVEELLADPTASDPHALTPALADLARQKSELDAADRRRARAILARPPDDGNLGPGDWSVSESDAAASACGTHFCFHWVDNAASDDSPDLSDGDTDGVPDYVELVARSFERAYTIEVETLGWRAPVSDGTRGTGSGLVDVYLSDIGPTYGYAVPEAAARSTYGYLVVDNDYSAAEFPDYGGDPRVPVEVTAAHEFNHILQYAYDADQDRWMFESTATWAEEKVFNDDNDYVAYIDSWAALPGQPLTDAGDGLPTDDKDLKMYGSAIWNHWLERRYGAQVVRQAWAVSPANSDLGTGYGFAPRAYDRAIKDSCGPGFTFEVEDFTSSVAEWQAPNSGIHEGADFPVDVARDGDDIAVNAPGVTGTVDHTAFQLHDVPSAPASRLYLTGSLPAGTPGSIALVGRTPDGTMVKALGILNPDGRGVVSLAPGTYARVTAVVTNADARQSGFIGSDWVWSRDAQNYSLEVSTTAPSEPAAASPPAIAPCTPGSGTGTPPTTSTPEPVASPSPTPSVTPTPTVTPPIATSLRLTRNSSRIGSVLRKGVLSLYGQANKAGSHSARATVDATTAKRLKVGRRTTTAGTGRRTATAPARLKINVKLTRKLRAALKRHRKRSVKVKVAVTFTPADGTAALRETITVKLRP
jgi:hypothetical protein